MTTVTQDVISTKFARHFDALDADQDGQVNWAEYQKFAERYLDAYRIERNDRRAQALLAASQMQWMELLRHAGADSDRLTKEQFVTASRSAAYDTSRLNVAEGGAHAIFDLIDVDGDNTISRDEFARLLRDVWRSEAPDAMESFERLDTDGDGEISRQEFIRAFREYHLSSDPQAPGSLFYGQI